jgi:hypothetical protein
MYDQVGGLARNKECVVVAAVVAAVVIVLMAAASESCRRLIIRAKIWNSHSST